VRIEELQDLVRAAPFRPFAIGLADGSRFTIEHPEWIAFRGGRTAVVLDPDDRVHLIDVMLALKIEVAPPVPAGSIQPDPNGGA
jgi:hypothetical protein